MQKGSVSSRIESLHPRSHPSSIVTGSDDVLKSKCTGSGPLQMSTCKHSWRLDLEKNVLDGRTYPFSSVDRFQTCPYNKESSVVFRMTEH